MNINPDAQLAYWFQNYLVQWPELQVILAKGLDPIVFGLGWIDLSLLGFLLVILFVVWPNEHHRRTWSLWWSKVLVIGMTSLVAWGIARLIKSWLRWPRPYQALEGLRPLVEYGGFDSFPSGHAMFFAAVAVIAGYLYRPWGWIAMVVALLIGVLRMFSGIHFVSDILAGWGLGVLVSLCVIWLIQATPVRKLSHRKKLSK